MSIELQDIHSNNERIFGGPDTEQYVKTKRMLDGAAQSQGFSNYDHAHSYANDEYQSFDDMRVSQPRNTLLSTLGASALAGAVGTYIDPRFRATGKIGKVSGGLAGVAGLAAAAYSIHKNNHRERVLADPHAHMDLVNKARNLQRITNE